MSRLTPVPELLPKRSSSLIRRCRKTAGALGPAVILRRLRIDCCRAAAKGRAGSAYRCADHRLLYIFAVDHDRFPRALLDVLGLWPRLQAKGLIQVNAYASANTQRRNNLADSTRLSWKWQKRLRAELASCFAKRSAESWEAELMTAGIPCSVQRDTREWLRLPSLLQAGIVERSGDRHLGPGVAAWLVKPVGTRSQSQPARVLSKGDGPRLSGHLVLDLTNMVAGPVCGRTLAEYGAEVIKIDSPHPHHGPRLTCWYGVDVNQGKRSLILDLAYRQVVRYSIVCSAERTLFCTTSPTLPAQSSG